MTNYFITGGAGFVGSHLAERLLKEGHTVDSLDSLETGKIKNIARLRSDFPDRFTHYTGSIECNEQVVAEKIDASDVVYHLAAAVGVQNVVDKPTHTLETNLRTTEIMLKYASKKGKRFLTTSTSEVYGKGGANGPFRETDDLIIGPTHNSRWCYAVSKLADEHLVLAHHRERGLPATVVRLFNTTGPKQTGKYGMVVPRFIGAALENKPIEVYGTGEQTRCFCHVDDVVTALVDLTRTESTVGEIYNIGNPVEISMNELADKVKRRLGGSSEIKHIPYEEAYGPGFEDMQKRVPCIDKIQAAIGWKPTKDLDQIIDSTAEHMKSTA